MKRPAKVYCLLFAVICCAGCIRTKNVSGFSKRPGEISSPDYIGTFSSISIIKNDTLAVYNDSLTNFTNYIYDSVIHATVKKLQPVKTMASLPAGQAERLSAELVKVAVQSEKKEGLKKTMALPAIDSVSSLSSNRYSAYFINYGNTWSKKDYRKIQGRNAIFVSVAAVGLVMLTAIATGGGNASQFIDRDEKGIPSPKKTIPVEGVYCYLIIYDKEQKQVCFVRKQFYSTGKANNAPFHPNKINQQITTIFKEYM